MLIIIIIIVSAHQREYKWQFRVGLLHSAASFHTLAHQYTTNKVGHRNAFKSLNLQAQCKTQTFCMKGVTCSHMPHDQKQTAQLSPISEHYHVIQRTKRPHSKYPNPPNLLKLSKIHWVLIIIHCPPCQHEKYKEKAIVHCDFRPNIWIGIFWEIGSISYTGLVRILIITCLEYNQVMVKWPRGYWTGENTSKDRRLFSCWFHIYHFCWSVTTESAIWGRGWMVDKQRLAVRGWVMESP